MEAGAAAIAAISKFAADAAVAATIAVTGNVALGATVGNAILTVAPFAIKTGAALALSAVLTPSVDLEGSPLTVRSDQNAGVNIIYGRRAVAGVVRHVDEWGKDNRYYSEVRTYSRAGPIQSFGAFLADQGEISFDADGKATTQGGLRDSLWISRAPGDQPQATALSAPALPAAAQQPFGPWGPAYRMSGVAQQLITWFVDSKLGKFNNLRADYLQEIANVPCYDPRFDDTYPGGSGSCRHGDVSTYLYTGDNPWIAALNWVLGHYENGVLVAGIGAELEGVYLPSFVEGANVADANGWTVSAWPSTRDNEFQVYQGLLQAGNGRHLRVAGRFHPVVRTARAPVMTLTADDTEGPLELDLKADHLTAVKSITPQVAQENAGWQEIDQPTVSTEAGVRARTIRYPYVALSAEGANADQPGQLALYDLLESQEPMAGRIPVKPWVAAIQPGWTFDISEPEFFLDGAQFQVTDREFDPLANRLSIGVRSESPGKHAFALGQTNIPPDPPGLNIPDIFDVPAPEAGAFTLAAGTGRQPALILTGAADNTTARALRVEVRPALNPATDQAWASLDEGWEARGEYDIGATQIVLAGLEPETVYEVTLRYVSAFNIVGERLDPPLQATTGTLNATHFGDLTWPDIEALIADADGALADAIDALDQALAAFEQATNTALDDVGNDLDAAEATLGQAILTVNERVDETEARATEIETALNADREAARGAVRDLNARLAGLRGALVADITERREDLNEQIDRIDALIVSVGQLGMDQGEADALIATLQTVQAGLVQDLDTLTTTVSAQATQLTQIAADASAALSASSDNADAIVIAEGAITALADVQATIVTDLNTLSQTVTNQSTTLDTINSAITVLRDDVDAQDARLTLAEGEITQTQTTLSEVETDLDGAITDIIAASEAVLALDAQANHPETGLEAAHAAIVEQRSALASLRESAVSALRQLQARFATAQGQALAEIRIRAEELNVQIDRIDALSVSLGDIETDLAQAAADIQSLQSLTADIDIDLETLNQTVTSNANALTALSSSVAQLITDTDDLETAVTLAEGNITTLQDTTSQLVTDLSGVIQDIIANSEAILALDAQVNDPETGLEVTRADVIQQGVAQASLREAMARALQVVSARVAGLRGQIIAQTEVSFTEREALLNVLTALELAVGEASDNADPSGSVFARVAQLFTITGDLVNQFFSLSAGTQLQLDLDQALLDITSILTAIADLPNQYFSLTAGTQLSLDLDAAELAIDSVLTAIADLPNQYFELAAGQQLQLDVDAAELAIADVQAITADLPNQYYRLIDGTVLEASVSTLDGELDAVAADVASIIIDVDDLLVTRLINVSAGPSSAGVQFVAQNSGGQPTSAINMFGQVFGYGATSTDPRHYLDGIENRRYVTTPNGLVRTVEEYWDSGRYVLRDDTGTLLFDTAAGGVQPAAIPPGTAGGKRRLAVTTHTFSNISPGIDTPTQTASDFIHFAGQTAALAIVPGALIEVDLSYFLATIKNAFSLLTMRHRIIIESVSGTGEIVSDWVPIRPSAAGNANNQNEHGSGEMWFPGAASLDFTTPTTPDADWPATNTVRARIEIETWNSGRSDTRVVHYASGANQLGENNTFLKQIRAVIVTSPPDSFDLS